MACPAKRTNINSAQEDCVDIFVDSVGEYKFKNLIREL